MSAPEPRAVTLRTGAEVPGPLVRTVQYSLGVLMDTQPIALYDALMLARDRSYVPFGNTGEALRDVGLLENNEPMHEAVRDVVLASIRYEDGAIHLVSPYADDAAKEPQS